MSICDYFITIASRASAKSWLIAVYACAKAVLYPHSEIVLVSATQKTAGIIMEKIRNLMAEYPVIAAEIEKYSNGANERICRFRNTSTIKVVACRDSGRGSRATLTIGEEFRIMDKNNYDSIVKPFAYARVAPYMSLPEWSTLPPEEPQEILISSAYHKGLWWYDETAKAIKLMLRGASAGFITFDYITAVYHKIKTINLIEKEKATMDVITFQEEYANIPWGENSDAYFKLAMFQNNSNIKTAFYPQRRDKYNQKKNPYAIKKMDGEIRVVSADIATRAGSGNDNTVISCIRCLPTSNGYAREYCYMESHNGENTIIQAKRLKQVFYDFESDYLVLDVANNGISIYDDLGTVTKDDERGCEYPAWTVLYTEDIDKKVYDELLNRTIAKNAEDIIYPINVTAKLNSDIAVAFREKLQKKMISFLINEVDADEYLLKTNPDYLKYNDEISERAWFLHPYIQYSNMINESVSLSMSIVGTNIKLTEPSGGRKDRYTSVSYGNYFIATVLDPTIRKDGENDVSGIINCAFY